MRTSISKPLIFVVISVLVVALVYSSISVSAAVTRGPKECTLEDEGIRLQCCQTETDDEGIEIRWCTDCRVKAGVGYSSCGPRYQALEASTPTPGDTGVFEQPLTPPPGPAAPLQGGVLEQQEPPTPPTPPLSPDMPTLETVPPNRTLPGGDIPTLEAVPPETGTMEQRAPGTSPPPQSAACYPNCPPPPPPPPPPNHVVQQTPPSGPAAPLKGGNLEQLEQGSSPELGFSERQQPPPADQGAAQLPPATEGSQPATVEEEQPVPVCQEGLEFNEDLGFCVPTECPEGQELNEETGICVLEEQPAAAEEPQEEAEPEEDQPSEESGSEDGNN